MVETPAQDWDAYWTYHQQIGYINYTPEIIWAVKRLLNVKGRRILEIGVGTGGNSSTLAKLGAEVYVLDLSRTALTIAMHTATRSGVQLVPIECDAHHLPFDAASFDLVFHQGFLEHFGDPRPLLHEQRRVIKPDGFLLVDVPQKYNLYTVWKHLLIRQNRWEYGGWETEFSYEELCSLLKECGFEVKVAYGRGYYPRLFAMIRDAQKIESKWFHRKVLPERLWRLYDRFWKGFELSWVGLYCLQCIGVVGQKH